MGVVGLVTSPMLGKIADQKAHEQFVAEKPAVVSVLDSARNALQAKLPTVHADQQRRRAERDRRHRQSRDGRRERSALPPIETANAMRSIIGTGVTDPSITRVQALLGPAENYGGRASFRSASHSPRSRRWCSPCSTSTTVAAAAIASNG